MTLKELTPYHVRSLFHIYCIALVIDITLNNFLHRNRDKGLHLARQSCSPKDPSLEKDQVGGPGL